MAEIVDANGLELIEAIDRFCGIPSRGEPDIACFDALKAISQRLHNWLASAYSFQQSVKVLTELHAPLVSPEFRAAFKPRYAECFGAPVVAFVRELRAFQQHYRIPVASGYFRLVDVDLETSVPIAGVTLPIRSLRVVGRSWKGAAAEYLDVHPDGVNLRHLESEYRAEVTSFIQWLWPALMPELGLGKGHLPSGVDQGQ